MIEPQIIIDEHGNPAFAVIPWCEYERLAIADGAAGLSDEELYDRAKEKAEESFPVELADRLLAGHNAIRVFRDHRGLTQKQLAEAVGIHPMYLSQIETGRRTGSARTLAAIAAALRVDIDDLI